MAKVRLEYKDKVSQKFWEVSATGSTINVKYGKLGTAGQNSVKKRVPLMLPRKKWRR